MPVPCYNPALLEKLGWRGETIVIRNLLRSIVSLDRGKRLVVVLMVFLVIITWAAFCFVLSTFLPG
jgi:hypothetical protein